MSTVDNSYLLNLFSSSSSSTSNLFAALIPAASSTSTPSVSTSISNAARFPTPPWITGSTAPQQAALVTTALAQQPIINQNAINLDVNMSSEDYTKLFTLYQGLNALDGLATDASASNLSAIQLKQYASAFSAGLSQVMSYANTTKFDNLQIAAGRTSTSQTSSAGVSTAINSTQFLGQVMYTGDPSQPAPAFEGDVQFAMNVKELNGPTIAVNFDLSEMGSTPRTMANVVSYLNGKLTAAGVKTQFADKETQPAASTVTVNGKTVTLPDPPPQFALQLNTSSLETVSLSAPATADAIYVTQSSSSVTTGTATTPVLGTQTTSADNQTVVTSGSTTTTTTVQQQLLKFQTDESSTTDAPPDAEARPGDANSVAGRAWSENLASATTSALATATGADGSVYVLSTVDDGIEGQSIAGASDVALTKYDSSGNLIYARTLGASINGQGLSMAVSATGQVAIAGSVTGALTGTSAGTIDPSSSDSFVSLYDTSGNEVWTQSSGGVGADQANAVAFGAAGQVYVAGKTQGSMPGAAQAQGGWDGYLQGYSASGALQFTQQFGAAGSDSATSIAVDGSNVYVAGVDGSDATVRSFDVSSPKAPVLTATEDLGNLNGGNVVGVAISNGQVVVAGTSRNPSLGAGVATAVNTAPGGANVFLASLDPSLSSAGTNTIAWYGGSGDDTATAMTVANGQIYIAGKTSTDLPGTTPIGKTDGFLVQLDPTSGDPTWTERFSGSGGNVAPESIAVASGGASVLDRLGLPSGKLQFGDPSNLVTSATSLRAGDKFTVAANGNPPTTVTIEADDTMQTLAQKIERASGSNAVVSVQSNGSVAQLNIKPYLQSSEITLGNGPAGLDALGPLGLTAGVIEKAPLSSSSPTTDPLMGLNLTNALNLNSTASIAQAKSVMAQALTTLKTAFQDLVSQATPKTAANTNNSASGPVPTYLANQISNYTAALQRLTGA